MGKYEGRNHWEDPDVDGICGYGLNLADSG